MSVAFRHENEAIDTHRVSYFKEKRQCIACSINGHKATVEALYTIHKVWGAWCRECGLGDCCRVSVRNAAPFVQGYWTGLTSMVLRLENEFYDVTGVGNDVFRLVFN
jgi:hypothetical protein